VETLAASGKWFKAHYKVTPATSVTINHDIDGSDRKTVWFDSRFYRVNFLWEKGTLRIRDIHLFNEQLPSVYEKHKATSNECTFFTLPVVDGYLWSNAQQIAGLRLQAYVDGKATILEGVIPVINSPAHGKLHITWPLKNGYGTLIIDLDERVMKMHLIGGKPIDWFWELTVADSTKLPFKKIGSVKLTCNFQGMDYFVKATAGSFAKSTDGEIFKIVPENNSLTLNLSDNK
jgi:hypothetical protein